MMGSGKQESDSISVLSPGFVVAGIGLSRLDGIAIVQPT